METINKEGLALRKKIKKYLKANKFEDINTDDVFQTDYACVYIDVDDYIEISVSFLNVCDGGWYNIKNPTFEQIKTIINTLKSSKYIETTETSRLIKTWCKSCNCITEHFCEFDTESNPDLEINCINCQSNYSDFQTKHIKIGIVDNKLNEQHIEHLKKEGFKYDDGGILVSDCTKVRIHISNELKLHLNYSQYGYYEIKNPTFEQIKEILNILKIAKHK